MSPRVAMFGIHVDAVRMQEAVARVLQWTQDGASRSCRYVVTPNVDHLVQLRDSGPLRAAYGDASLVLADGAPVVLASRLLGSPLPERVAGSDLVPALFDAAAGRGGMKVFLLGGAPPVTARAARSVEQRWPAVEVVGTASPPLGFEHDGAENERILAQIRAVSPDVVVIGLGAPKQEIWVHRHRERLVAGAAICAGATIDFLAGAKRRAPRWMRRSGLEWLHRLASEPRRLLRRYAWDAWVFPRLLWTELRTRSAQCLRSR